MSRVTDLTIAAVVALTGIFLFGCETQERSPTRALPTAAGAQEGGQRQRPGELEEGEEGEGEEEGEEKVSLDSLPAPVRAAAEKALRGASDLTAEKETENGVPHYEVAGWKDGKGVTVTLSGDGEVVEFETEISFTQLPRAVQERMKKEHPNVSFGVIELVEPRYYELKFKADGKGQEIQVYPSGLPKKD